MAHIGIIDIGLGNVDSVSRAISFIGYKSSLCCHIDDLKNVDLIIFPGVGSFNVASKKLKDSGFDKALRKEVLENKKPILGICLGMQLLCTKGYEGGEANGLGLVEGEVCFHRAKDRGLSIPHMGWNDVCYTGGILYNGINNNKSFYFVHSYEVLLKGDNFTVATTNHGVDFVSSFEKDNVFGVQFHPEKSQEDGLQLLRNFITTFSKDGK